MTCNENYSHTAVFCYEVSPFPLIYFWKTLPNANEELDNFILEKAIGRPSWRLSVCKGDIE